MGCSCKRNPYSIPPASDQTAGGTGEGTTTAATPSGMNANSQVWVLALVLGLIVGFVWEETKK